MSIGSSFTQFMVVTVIVLVFLGAAEASTAAAGERHVDNNKIPSAQIEMSPWNATTGWTRITGDDHNKEISTSTTSLPWKGSWKFERTWFEKQHPWLPKFVARKVLSSTLILGADSYHQVDDEGKPLKEKRFLTLLDETEQKVQLARTEGKKQIHFHLERRDDGHVYYVERGLGDYRILSHVHAEHDE